MKTSFYIQYAGREFDQQQIVDEIKARWKQEGNTIKSISTLAIYLKPEEHRVYYLINGDTKGSIAL